MESVLQRLGFIVDTSGLMRGQAAMDSAAAAGIRLGGAADLASLRLSSMGKGPVNNNLRGVATEMDRAANATRAFGANAEQVNTKLTTLGVAAGTVAGILAFQVIGAIAGVASELASLPLESARAADALTRFNSQLMFAFRGSSDVVRQARSDILALARDAGVPLAQLRNDYADIAISGRAAGLTRSQVSGVVGAFAQLGQLSGADPGALSRSMYQYQQMLNIGQVRWSDFKLADLNLPAFGDAAAEGLGVSSAELVGMISRGELSAYRLTEALAEGVPRLLEEAGGELPQLMSRSQAAMETEWTRLLEKMGQAWETSKFIQSLQYGIADLLRNLVDSGDGSTELARLRNLARNSLPGFPGLAGIEARIVELETQQDLRRGEELESAARALTEEERQAREARHRNAFGIVSNLDPIRAAQAQARADMDLVRGALSDTTGLTAEQIGELRRGLSLLEGQISRIESAVDRARRQSRQSAADLARYGPGGGFDLARGARGLVEQSINQMRPISMAEAMSIVRGEWLTGAANDNGQAAAELARRQIGVDAAGLDVTGRRRAQLDAEEAEMRARFGRREDMSAEQAARVDELAAERRRIGAERFAQDDVQALRERERADRERFDAMREQLALGIQLGQQGRIAIAMAERERELRREFPQLSGDLLRAELERVEANIRIGEQLSMQQREMALLADSAQTAGRALGDALSAGIVAGIRSGKDGAEAALNALARAGERILSNLLSRATAPFERRLEEMAAGRLQGWFGRGDGGEGPDAAMSALGEAAEGAAENIMGAMVPSITEAGAKIAVSTTATASEASARAAATLATQSFTGAVLAAANAAHIFAASAAASGGADFASSVVKALPGFASGVRNFSGGLAIVGEEGPELVRLPRGADVYSHGQSKAMLGAGETNVQVNIIDQRGAGAGAVETRESRGPNGERILDVLVTEKVNQGIKKGAFNSALGAQFGMTPQIRKA